MKTYVKPKTILAKTVYDEIIEVIATNKRCDYYREIINEPIWIPCQNKFDDKGRLFHYSELMFLK